MMKIPIVFLFSLIVGQVFSAPVDNSEVEFVEPVSTNGDEKETSIFNIGQSPVFVIHGRIPQDFPQGFPQFGIPGLSPSNGFPFSFESFFGPPPRRSQNGSDDAEVEIDFFPPSTFNDEKDGNNSKPFCGFFCKIFADLEKQLAFIGQQKGGLFPTIDSDKANTTYTEKVLPDGTVVRVNQTTFSDADGNGNAFFFHTATHFVDGSDGQTEKVDEEEIYEDEDDKSPEGPSKPKVEIIPEEEIGFKLPEDFDPNLNEVSEGNLLTRRISKRSAEESDTLPAYGHNDAEPLIPIGDRDIRVNKLLLENGKRGGLFKMDPDSELIVEVDDGLVVPLDEIQSGEETEWNQQSQSKKSTWNNQQRSSIIHYPDH